MNRKKILHIITGLEVGGAETNLSRVIPHIEKDFENRIVCLKGEGVIGERFKKNNIPVYYLHIEGIFDFFNPRVIYNFRKIIKDFRPDVIETYLIHADIFGRVWGRIFGVKKIICSHRGSLLQWEWFSFMDKITSFLVTKYVFQTPSAQKEIAKKLGINLNKTTVIPNVIDLKSFEFDINKNEKMKELGIKEENINIVSVSNLRKGKGHKYLIEAFNEVFKENKNIHPVKSSPGEVGKAEFNGVNLIIVGDGDQRPILQNQADISEARENIYFLGKRSDVLEILKISEIFILPTFYEGMSNAIMEAMASKLAIITTNIKVNHDLIKDSYSGILVPVANSEAIKNSMLRLLESPEERIRLGENALNEIKNKYSLEIVSEKIANLFESL
ncbi:MAG: glycosyltransferase [Patescibacteria group bacterium]